MLACLRRSLARTSGTLTIARGGHRATRESAAGQARFGGAPGPAAVSRAPGMGQSIGERLRFVEGIDVGPFRLGRVVAGRKRCGAVPGAFIVAVDTGEHAVVVTPLERKVFHENPNKDTIRRARGLGHRRRATATR
jgi:hypothetical protein